MPDVLSSVGFLFFIAFVLLATLLTGCTMMQGSPSPDPAVNETALAIEIALNNSSVRESLTDPWTIMEVDPSSSSFPIDGKYVTIRTSDVKIDMKSKVVHVFVDLGNRSVVHIWENPKRSPMPGMRSVNNSSGLK